MSLTCHKNLQGQEAEKTAARSDRIIDWRKDRIIDWRKDRDSVDRMMCNCRIRVALLAFAAVGSRAHHLCVVMCFGSCTPPLVSNVNKPQP
jgi:hypothetical protein